VGAIDDNLPTAQYEPEKQPEPLETTVSIAREIEPDEVRRRFEEDGFYLARNVYPEAALREMEAEYDRIVQQLKESGEQINARWESARTDELDGGASRIIHTHNVQRYSARWLQALQEDRLLDVVEQILGPDIVLHHSKLFQKPPREGAPFPMHQDWTYFPTEKDTMIAGIVFLSDADERSGGLRVYRGSHKLGRIENSSGRTSCETLDNYPLENAEPVDAKRGDVFFFSYLTLHGSTPNRSGAYRKTVLAQFYSGRDRVVTGDGHEHVNEALVLRGWNHEMSREVAAN